MVLILPATSPSVPHLFTILSSLAENSWQSGDHATAVQISVSTVHNHKTHEGKWSVTVQQLHRTIQKLCSVDFQST
jgi:hypothetical protein